MLDAVLVPALRFCGQPARWTGNSTSHKGEVGISARVTFEALSGERASSDMEVQNEGSTAVYYSWQRLAVPHSFPDARTHTHTQHFYFNTSTGTHTHSTSTSTPPQVHTHTALLLQHLHRYTHTHTHSTSTSTPPHTHTHTAHVRADTPCTYTHSVFLFTQLAAFTSMHVIITTCFVLLCPPLPISLCLSLPFSPPPSLSPSPLPHLSLSLPISLSFSPPHLSLSLSFSPPHLSLSLSLSFSPPRLSLSFSPPHLSLSLSFSPPHLSLSPSPLPISLCLSLSISVPGVILPGDSKRVEFIFKSEVPGIRTEVWRLNTHPVLLGGASIQVTLRGVALYQDKTADQRHALERELQQREAASVCRSLVCAVLRGVLTPERPGSPAELYTTEEEHFHNRNPKLQYRYETVEALKSLWQQVTAETGEDRETAWDLSVSTLRQAVLALPQGDGEQDGPQQRLTREGALSLYNTLLLELTQPLTQHTPLPHNAIGLQLWRELLDGLVSAALWLRHLLGLPETDTWGEHTQDHHHSCESNTQDHHHSCESNTHRTTTTAVSLIHTGPPPQL
uniref:Uncharacterized protein n=1 Tax=Oncorhynchus mykiss TaxID=8022 RepID=A0A8L0DNR0_ONCMY